MLNREAPYTMMYNKTLFKGRMEYIMTIHVLNNSLGNYVCIHRATEGFLSDRHEWSLRKSEISMLYVI